MATDFQSYGALVAAGSTQATATALTYHISHVTDADDVKGVILPPVQGSHEIIIYNYSTAALKIYPAVGEKIDFFSTDAAIYVEGYRSITLRKIAVLQWTVASIGRNGNPGSINTCLGSTQADALPFNYGITEEYVNNANGVKGCKLPVYDFVYIGYTKTVYNHSASNLLIYPGLGDQIINLGVNINMTLGGHKVAIFRLVSANLWSLLVTA